MVDNCCGSGEKKNIFIYIYIYIHIYIYGGALGKASPRSLVGRRHVYGSGTSELQGL